MSPEEVARWRAEVKARSVSKVPERPNLTRSGGEPWADVYTSLDPRGAEELPGVYPYTRGVQPTMYRGALWTMRQYAGFGTAEASNQRYRYLLSQGTTGLSVAFDLPTQMGYDPDAALASGEVGRVGVSVCGLDDLRVLFSGIPLDRVSTSMTINATASTLLALYVAIAEEQGVNPSALRGTIQNDILKEYVARGTYIYPPRASMRLVTDTFRWCHEVVPKWNTISISGYHIREAGSTAAQELAFTLADGIAYVQAAVEAGFPVDHFAPRLSFFFNAHNNLLEEVGKFRAARRLWARIMKERFGAKDPASCTMRFHTQTAGSTLTAQQIDVNVVRVTLQALAAVLGGTQSLHTNSRDEALALPTEASARLALRTQQVIAFESGVADVVDPLGGAYAVEHATDALEDAATKLISEVDSLGGMVSAIEQGFPQREIQEAAYAAQRAIEAGRQKVVGVNCFREAASEHPALLRVDPEIERERVDRVREARGRRDRARVADATDRIRDAAAGTDNLLPPILEAVRAGATLGEVSDTLRGVFGTWSDLAVL